MAKKVNFDLKQFLLQKGERFGVAVAAGIAALLLVLGIMTSLGKSSPLDSLNKGTKDLKNKIQSAPVKIPPEFDKQIEPPAFIKGRDPETTPTGEWVTRVNLEDTKRKNPEVKVPGGYQVDVVHVPVREIDYSGGNSVLTVVGKGATADPQNPRFAEKVRPAHMVIVSGVFPYKEQLEAFKWALRLKKEEALNQLPKFQGFYVYRRDTLPNGQVRKFRTPKDNQSEWALLDLNDDRNNDKERKKFDSWDAFVLRSDFRKLLSLTPERAAWDPNMRNVAFTGLVMPLPALFDNAAYPPVKLKGLPEPPEPDEKGKKDDSPDPRKPPIGPMGEGGDSRTKGRGPVYGGDPKNAEGDEGGSIKPVKIENLSEEWRNWLSGKGISVFDPDGQAIKEENADKEEQPGGGGEKEPPAMDQTEMMKKYKDRFMDRRNMMGRGYKPPQGIKGGGNDNRPVQEDTTKEKSLFRFIDVDVQPGHTYEYLITIRLTNPNYKRYKEVAAKKFASLDELWSQAKYIPPVHVPYGVQYYAADEAALDTKWKSSKTITPGADKSLPSDNREKVAIQIHQWFPEVEPFRHKNIKLGDWLVAERLLVQRGDFIAKDQVPTLVPEWSAEKEKFHLATTLATKGFRKRKDVLVDFSTKTENGLPPALLVDIHGGKQMRNIGKRPGVLDNAAAEILVLTPEGDLVVRNSRQDSSADNPVGKERIDRLEAYKARVKKLKEASDPTKKNADGGVFNPMGDKRR
jgi:hypothetical protein